LIDSIKYKVYLEGKRVQVTNIIITSGKEVTAAIQLGYPSRGVTKLKPGTVCHVFLYMDGHWRIMFVGRYAGFNGTALKTSLQFTSY